MNNLKLKNWRPELHPAIFEKQPKTYWDEKIEINLMRLYGNKEPISIYQDKYVFFDQFKILMSEMIALLKAQDNYTVQYENLLTRTKEKISNALDLFNPLIREQDIYFAHFKNFEPEHYQKIKEALEILVGYFKDVYELMPIQALSTTNSKLKMNTFYVSFEDYTCIFCYSHGKTQQVSLVDIKEALVSFPQNPTQEKKSALIEDILQCITAQGYSLHQPKEQWILQGLIDDMGECDLALLGGFKDAANTLLASSNLTSIVQSIIRQKIILIASKHSKKIEDNYTEDGTPSAPTQTNGLHLLNLDKSDETQWAHAHIFNAIKRLLNPYLKGIDELNYAEDIGDEQTAIYFEKLLANKPDNPDDYDAFDILLGEKNRVDSFYNDLKNELSAHSVITALGGRLRDLMIIKKPIYNYKTINELLSNFDAVPFFNSSDKGISFYLEKTKDNSEIFIRYDEQAYRLKNVKEIEEELIKLMIENKSTRNYESISELIGDFGAVPFFDSTDEGLFLYLEKTEDKSETFINYCGQGYRPKNINKIAEQLIKLMIEKKPAYNYKTTKQLVSDFGEVPFFDSGDDGVFFYLEETENQSEIFISLAGEGYRLKSISEIEKKLVIACADKNHTLSVKKMPASFLVTQDKEETPIYVSDGTLYLLPESFIPNGMRVLYKYKTQGKVMIEIYSDQKVNDMVSSFLSSNPWMIQALFQRPEDRLSIATIAASIFPEIERKLREEFIPNLPHDANRQNLIQQLFYGYLMTENWLALYPEWLEGINKLDFAEGFTKISNLEALIEKIISASLNNPDALLPTTTWLLEAFLAYQDKNHPKIAPIFLLKPLLVFFTKNKTEKTINYFLDLFSKNPIAHDIREHYLNWKNLRLIWLKDTSTLQFLTDFSSHSNTINLNQINAARSSLPEKVKQKAQLNSIVPIKEMIKQDLAYYENLQIEVDSNRESNNTYSSTSSQIPAHSSAATKELPIWLPAYLVRLSKALFEHHFEKNIHLGKFFAKKVLIPLVYLDLPDTMLNRIIAEGLKPENPTYPETDLYLEFFLKTLTEIMKDSDKKDLLKLISSLEEMIEMFNSQARLSGKKRSFDSANTDTQVSSSQPTEKRLKITSVNSIFHKISPTQLEIQAEETAPRNPAAELPSRNNSL